ncbi:MAG: AAA family ATPase [Deltaproteobacteria bacterium]|nr:AAA family ATPase [Deltaproteobacteria bacterium]
MIRLDSVQLRWFRGVREGAIGALADVSLLVGRNNSGKTTVVEAISWAAEAWSGHPDGINRTRHELWTKARGEAQARFPWSSNDSAHKPSVAMQVGGVPVTVQARNGSTERVPPPGNDTSADRFVRAITVFRPADGFDPDIENSLWPELLKDRRDKALLVGLNEIYGLSLEQLQVLPDRKLLLLYPDCALALDVHGDGTRTALRCLVVLSALRGTLLCVEEPESHQHPAALGRLAAALCKQAKEQDVQLVVTTQSRECIDAFAKGAAAAHSEAAVFHLRLRDGMLDVRRLTADDHQRLDEQGLDVRLLDLYV